MVFYNLHHSCYVTGAVKVSALEFFSEGIGPALLTSVNCSGTENEILECDHFMSAHGLFCDPAGVVCQCKRSIVLHVKMGSNYFTLQLRWSPTTAPLVM